MNGNEKLHLNLSSLDEDTRDLVVLEALLKRMALVNMPFVLKGSLLTRQYLANPDMRDVDDIDFLYAGKIRDAEHAHETFTSALIRATEMDLQDGIVFRSFRENAFWRRIDYAMADDFPTVNTDIAYYFAGEKREANRYHELYLDISFHLDMQLAPVSLEYRPVLGDSFCVPYTVPLSIQVAWKLHQTIVRPRFKDLYDLNYLLAHPAYDEQALAETLQALVDECRLEPSIAKHDMQKVLVHDLADLYPLLINDYELRKYAGGNNQKLFYMEFAQELRKTMNLAGINKAAFANLPSPSTPT
ncbi:nucleotidyl transferase AbiEii/AbiGii toxin family protein [Brevibacillus parabrevis]|uniref:nucleotidyl transferase AbiEii/AbiGii toxin family protein n=1 Tax=Brevibacillus parabrevis TaxID=54914 RepID=UPI001C23E32D|nr:nucleotidyl transferase AbiEii/AbiGii toxin family protein [Brevibacillus parabrevis]MBU8714599.1 nucleotidyl transferase AbiEii/AbiGii toxin family protein [Brevibacillus parabrevis]